MTEPALRRLLDQGVPPLPDDVATPPTAAIVRRARRRRRTTVAVAAAVGVAVVAAGALAQSRLSGAPPPAPGATVSPTFAWPIEDRPWVAARLARDDRMVTLFLHQERCKRLLDPTAAVVARDARRVTVRARATVLPIQCDLAFPVDPLVLLDEPLGDREVATPDGTPRRVYRDRDLPLPTGGWEERLVTAPRNDDDIFAVAVERDGSPPLVIRAAPTGRIGGPFGAPAGPADLGGVSGTVYERPAASGYEVRWTVGDLTYVLEADPGEGRSVTLAQFRQLLRSLRWDR